MGHFYIELITVRGLQIEMSRTYGITEWKEDLKIILKKAGFGEQPVVFLFSDTQVG